MLTEYMVAHHYHEPTLPVIALQLFEDSALHRRGHKPDPLYGDEKSVAFGIYCAGLMAAYDGYLAHEGVAGPLTDADWDSIDWPEERRDAGETGKATAGYRTLALYLDNADLVAMATALKAALEPYMVSAPTSNVCCSVRCSSQYGVHPDMSPTTRTILLRSFPLAGHLTPGAPSLKQTLAGDR